MKDQKTNRRQLKTRQAKWASILAEKLGKMKVTPNQLSVLSVVVAAFSGAFLILAGKTSCISTRVLSYGLAALFIQSRLLFNMLDGMLAVECGLKTKTGEIFNELPDRISDTIILLCAGFSVSYGGNAFGQTLGWMAALIALFTAYIRVFGVSLNTNAYFSGPMAKQHRMFTLTLGCLLALFFAQAGLDKLFITLVLICIIAGSIVTCVRRMSFIIKEVRAK